MRRLMAAFLVAVLACGQAGAASYYFSDCATGGAGTSGNPYCLDPDSDNIDESFEFLMDGTGTEAAQGDTIYLCAGDCNGSGSATWYLEPHTNPTSGKLVLFDPAVAGGSGANLITIRNYAGEGVVIRGDTNNDNTFDLGSDAERFWDAYVDDEEHSVGGYQFIGFTIEKFGGRVFNLADLPSGAYILDGMTVQRNGADSTIGEVYFAADSGDGGLYAMGCTDSTDEDYVNENLDYFATFVFARGHNGASLTVKNSTIAKNCQEVVRSNTGCYDSNGEDTIAGIEACNPTYSMGGITMENNTIYSVFGLHDGHQQRGWTWTANTAYDFISGISIEENTVEATITANDFSCRGTYKVNAEGRCKRAISVSDGDLGETDCDETGSVRPKCSSRDIYIGRNKIWGATYKGQSNPGYLLSGISYGGHNATSVNGGASGSTIENNFIWHVQSNVTCDPFTDSNALESPLAILTNDPITIQNNTLFDNGCPVYLRTGFSASEGGTGNVNHVVKDNIVGRCNQYYAAGDVVELFIGAAATGSTFESNNWYTGESSTNAICSGGTSGGMGVGGSCSGGSFVTCSTLSTCGDSTDCCGGAVFQGVSGAKSTWNLHLSLLGDSSNINKGTEAAVLDIDGSTRPECPDIGADETPWSIEEPCGNMLTGGGGDQ